jgi:hypothetical protein
MQWKSDLIFLRKNRNRKNQELFSLNTQSEKEESKKSVQILDFPLEGK